MRVRRILFALIATGAVALAVFSQNESSVPDGNYLLSMVSAPTAELRYAIVKIETKDGKPTVALVHDGPPPRPGKNGKTPKGPEVKVSDLKVSGQSVSFAFERFGQKFTFEGSTDPKDPKRLLGTISDGERLYRGNLVKTEMTELATKDMQNRAAIPDPIAELNKLMAPVNALAQKAFNTKDKAEQKKLRKEVRAMSQKVTEENAPGLYRKTIKDHADSPFAVTSAASLTGMATKIKAPAEEVAAWLKMQEADAERYGTKYLNYARYNLAESLSTQEAYAALTAKYADQVLADATLTNSRRSRALQILAAAQEQSGKADLAKATWAEFEKLEPILDEEYNKAVPPYKPEKYVGRKDKAANRVAVMELFTGTQCPPCVAADVGFDGLLKTYAPTDVILLQYHEHIPGPDPLTNPDSVARFEFYGELFEEGFGGTPSTAFNGKAQAGGGGGMSNSDEKYKEYREILDAALEQSSDIKIGGTAKQDGDKVTVSVEVTGMKEPKDTAKLRLILVEDNIRYVGSNGVRFHHHVVRSLFGKVEGVAVKGLKDGKHSAELNLAELRTSLKKYLDKYHAEENPFPRPARPLDLKGLKVVALVQDDATGEIFQAAQFELNGAKAGTESIK
jgi:hypothetical protein